MRNGNIRGVILSVALLSLFVLSMISAATKAFACQVESGKAAQECEWLAASPLAEEIKFLQQSNKWKLRSVIKLEFRTFHIQGLIKINDMLYASSVETVERPVSYASSDNLWDFSVTRTAGSGKAWLFKFGMDGRLIAKIEIGKGDAYHPGGMGYDGRYLWIPVAENRPNSFSKVVRIDPETMQAADSFNIRDHIGQVIYNPADGRFYGTSWGSRRIYKWKVKFDENGHGEVIEAAWEANRSHYVDYQDCQYIKPAHMLCTGVNYLRTPAGKIALGGLELLDISNRGAWPAFQLPVELYLDDRKEATTGNWHPSDPNLVLTNNGFWLERIGDKLNNTNKAPEFNLYFMTEGDGQADLVIYEAMIARPAAPRP